MPRRKISQGDVNAWKNPLVSAIPGVRSTSPLGFLKILLALVDRFHVLFIGSYISAAGANEAVVFRLFDHMRRPAGDARGHEERRIQRHLKAQGVIEPTRGPIE